MSNYQEIENIIYNIKSARNIKKDVVIPFDISHIILNALYKQVSNSNPAPYAPDDELECGNCGSDTCCREDDEVFCKYCGQRLSENKLDKCE